MIVGDMVSSVSTIVIDPPEGDMDDYIGSLEKLRLAKASTLFPGHGPAIAQADAKLVEFIEHREWREQRILAAWRRGLTEPRAILPVVYDDVPERLAARREADSGPPGTAAAIRRDRGGE